MNLKLSIPSFSLQILQKPYFKFAVLGFFFYIIFLLTTVPAEWLAWGLNKNSHGSVVLTKVSGNIWKGRGQLSISYNRAKPVNIGHIEWDIHALWLLLGKLNTTLDLTGEGLQLRTDLTVSFGELKLENMRATIQAKSLAALYSPISLVSPSGQISFSAENLSISDDGIFGVAKGSWLDAGSAISSVNPLGSYNFTLTGSGENAKITLDSSGNSVLKITGKGNWTLINGLINFNGAAMPVSKKSELESLLILLGRDTGSGKRILRFSTRVPFAFNAKK